MSKVPQGQHHFFRDSSHLWLLHPDVPDALQSRPSYMNGREESRPSDHAETLQLEAFDRCF